MRITYILPRYPHELQMQSLEARRFWRSFVRSCYTFECYARFPEDKDFVEVSFKLFFYLEVSCPFERKIGTTSSLLFLVWEFVVPIRDPLFRAMFKPCGSRKKAKTLGQIFTQHFVCYFCPLSLPTHVAVLENHSQSWLSMQQKASLPPAEKQKKGPERGSISGALFNLTYGTFKADREI